MFHLIISQSVLYYIKNFLMLVLFGSLQVFGLFGLSRNNKNVLIAFGSSLTIGFILAMFDHLFHSGYLHFAMYLLIESLFTFLYLLVLPIKQRPISNIHYIPMPSEDTFAQVVVTSPEYRYFRFWSPMNSYHRFISIWICIIIKSIYNQYTIQQ